MENQGYPLYKGLKKPLVFKGYKGKYIYWAAGAAIGGLIASVLMTKVIGFFGFFVGIGLISVALWWISMTQRKKGIYKKTANFKEFHLIPNRIKIQKRSKQ